MKFLAAVFILSTLALSCKKEGPGGDGKISVLVKHHNQVIPGATVYIKYGAKEFPGKDVSVYDDSRIAGVLPDNSGQAAFEGLRKGDYYLYSTGFDTTIMEAVTGGVGVRIFKNGDLVETVVPVTEDSH